MLWLIGEMRHRTQKPLEPKWLRIFDMMMMLLMMMHMAMMMMLLTTTTTTTTTTTRRRSGRNTMKRTV